MRAGVVTDSFNKENLTLIDIRDDYLSFLPVDATACRSEDQDTGREPTNGSPSYKAAGLWYQFPLLFGIE